MHVQAKLNLTAKLVNSNYIFTQKIHQAIHNMNSPPSNYESIRNSPSSILTTQPID